MADDPGGWTAAEKIGAALLAVLAVGLLFIAADMLSGGKLAKRKGGCGCDGEPESGTGD